jgi:hypothetical protein
MMRSAIAIVAARCKSERKLFRKTQVMKDQRVSQAIERRSHRGALHWHAFCSFCDSIRQESRQQAVVIRPSAVGSIWQEATIGCRLAIEITNRSRREDLTMHIVAADTIVADIATELELSPTEATLYLNDLLDDGDEYESTDFDS